MASATDCPSETDICTGTDSDKSDKSHTVTTRQAETEFCSGVSRLTLSNSTKLPNAVSNRERRRETGFMTQYVAVIYFLHQQFFFTFDNYA